MSLTRDSMGLHQEEQQGFVKVHKVYKLDSMIIKIAILVGVKQIIMFQLKVTQSPIKIFQKQSFLV